MKMRFFALNMPCALAMAMLNSRAMRANAIGPCGPEFTPSIRSPFAKQAFVQSHSANSSELAMPCLRSQHLVATKGELASSINPATMTQDGLPMQARVGEVRFHAQSKSNQ